MNCSKTNFLQFLDWNLPLAKQNNLICIQWYSKVPIKADKQAFKPRLMCQKGTKLPQRNHKWFQRVSKSLSTLSTVRAFPVPRSGARVPGSKIFKRLFDRRNSTRIGNELLLIWDAQSDFLIDYRRCLR